MNGAESLIRSLTGAGVDVCFANPGTSEMHLVQAIDAVPGMKAVLSLFEGVCTGAADGYGRMTGMPATTLLHLGPGLGNGIANLHNARRAGTPIINLIGNHALYHVEHDAPLTSDIDTLARNVSSWIKGDSTATSLAADGMAALQATLTATPGSKGQIATMIIPADACWNEAPALATALPVTPRRAVDDARIRSVADTIDAGTMLLLGSDGLTLPARIAAARIARSTGCRVAMITFPGRVDGGAGTPVCERLPYFPEQVLAALKGVSKLVLVGAETPVSFFAYPDVPSVLLPEGCQAIRLSEIEEDSVQALEALADQMGVAGGDYARYESQEFELPTGRVSTGGIAKTIAALLPEGAVLCGDSGGGGAAFGPVQSSRANTFLNLTGGSIGQGGPVSIGAAVACPDQRVLALLGDGASMYTNQSFWTQAREGLNVTTVIFNNSRYGILETEYLRLGVNTIGERAAELFDLSRPSIDYVALAGSMGVPGEAVTTSEGFAAALQKSLSTPGPYLIEAQL
ncbi:MAG: acetolactate synthase large subunit [Proteobacteria bacterium]|nr:acetolactate synthase large subunit [Pseudomonadota bacterium]